jgi:hypothetical protein
MIKDLTLQQERKLANRMYYGGGVTKKYEDGGAFAWKDDKTADLAGAGLSVASSATAAFDKTPDKYDGMDVAGSALKFASMGAAAGPVGALIGGAVGLGVGLFTKNKQEKEKEKAELLAEQRKQQDEGLANYMKDQEEFAGYEKGGVIKKGSKEYKKAYDTGNLANMVDIDGEQTAVFPDMDEITLTDKLPENLKGKDWMGIPKERSFQNQNYMKNLYKDNPVAQNVMDKNTGDSGNLWGNIVEGSKELLTASIMGAAPIPGLSGGRSFAGASSSKIYNTLAKEVSSAKAGYNMVKGAFNSGKQLLTRNNMVLPNAKSLYTNIAKPLVQGGLKSTYHGTKLSAAPAMLYGLGDIGLSSVSGNLTMDKTVKGVKSTINFANPLDKIPGVGKYSKDLIKTAADLYQDKGNKGAARFASMFFPKGSAASYMFKVGKDYISEDLNLAKPLFNMPLQAKNTTQNMFAQGGMTQGAYSHSTNPLTVVDKNGQDTGMELTGGEGVFDKPAMDRIKSMLAGGKVNEVGAFIDNEMKTWKHK